MSDTGVVDPARARSGSSFHSRVAEATAALLHPPISMPTKNIRRRLLTTAEACEYLGVSRTKLEAWVRSGFLPVVRLDGTIRRFDLDHLNQVINASTRTRGGRR